MIVRLAPRDRIEAGSNDRRFEQRPRQPVGEQASAGGRHRLVDCLEQTAGAFAAEGTRQFEIGPRRCVDAHRCGFILQPRQAQRRAGLELGPLDIGDDGSGGAAGSTWHVAQTVQRGQAEESAEPLARRAHIHVTQPEWRHRSARLPEQRREACIVGQRRRHDDLAGLQPRDLGRKLLSRRRSHREIAGRHVDSRDRVVVPVSVVAVAISLMSRLARRAACDAHQPVGSAGLQQPLFGEGARCHEPHHVAAHHRSVAALAGLRRVLQLFADGDAMACLDQALQIVVGPFDGHPAHRDVLARMLAALRQHDAERTRGLLGIVEEQFVEIAHPIEEQAVRVGCLDLDILRDHRRDAVGLYRTFGTHHPRFPVSVVACIHVGS